MDRVYKNTELRRETLVQEARVFVDVDKDAPATSYRMVQVLVPMSPKVSVGLDVTPKELGPNREYKLPVLPPGAQIRFQLLPDQFLVGAANEGYAEVTVVVEHHLEGV